MSIVLGTHLLVHLHKLNGVHTRKIFKTVCVWAYYNLISKWFSWVDHILINFCPKWTLLTGQTKQSSQVLCCCFWVKNSHPPHSKGEELQLHAGTNHNDTSYREKQNGAVKHLGKLYIDIHWLATSTVTRQLFWKWESGLDNTKDMRIIYRCTGMITLKTTITHHCITAAKKKSWHVICIFYLNGNPFRIVKYFKKVLHSTMLFCSIDWYYRTAALIQ